MHVNARTFCIVCIAAALLSVSAGLSPARASPETFVTNLSKQILAAARTRNSARFRSLLRRHTDVRGIANFALGRYRSKIPAARRRQYYKLAEDDIVNFFSQYSGSLRGRSVKVTRVSKSGKLILVETKLADGSSVLWRLSRNRGYKVRDVQVLGIWLGHLMRMAYTGELRRGGYRRLFAYLQQ